MWHGAAGSGTDHLAAWEGSLSGLRRGSSVLDPCRVRNVDQRGGGFLGFTSRLAEFCSARGLRRPVPVLASIARESLLLRPGRRGTHPGCDLPCNHVSVRATVAAVVVVRTTPSSRFRSASARSRACPRPIIAPAASLAMSALV